MLDLRQTPEYANYMSSIGWVVERKNEVNYFIRRIPLFGSFVKIQRPEKLDFNFTDQLARKYRAFQIVIEPKDRNQELGIRNKGYKLAKSPLLPSKTIHIDLTKSEEKLLKEMHYKTRYNIRKTISNKLKVTRSRNISQFADFWNRCAWKQRKMFLSQVKEIKSLYKAFGKNADLVFVEKNKVLLAGVLVIHADKISYYMYAASSDEGKKLFVPTLAAWQAIRISKKRGSEIFDFEGIYDERFPLKSWKGFTRFKKSFGGKEVSYPGAFSKIRLPV